MLQHRRRSIGAAYYAFLAQALARRATNRLLATVFASNAASRRLHDRCGFFVLGSMWDVRGFGSFTSAAVTAALRAEPKRISLLHAVPGGRISTGY